MASSASSCAASSPASIAPTERSVLRTTSAISTASPRSAAPTATSQRWSAATSRPWSWCSVRVRGAGRAGAVQQRLEIEVLQPRPPVGVRGAQQVGATDEILEPPHADLGHQLAHALRHEQQVAHHVVGHPREPAAQLRVLGRDADRARVEVADAHHHAAESDQRGRRERELLGAQQRADEHVTAGAQAAVDLQPHPAAQPVHDEHLLRLGQPELPRQAGVLERRQRRGTGAAVVAGDHDVLGLRLGDAGGDGADAGLGHELDRDLGRRVDRLQVVDQLRQVLDRVDVVVRRRRDQPDAGRRVAEPRDQRVDLVARQLPALAGLGALRHLDLQLVGIDAGTSQSRRSALMPPA